RDVPARIVLAHFSQVAVVADVIAGARLLDVRVSLRLAGVALHQLERFEDRHRVRLPAAEIVDLGHARDLDERVNEAADSEGVDVVAHLLALVPEPAVLAILDVALDEIAQKPVQFDPAMTGAGEAPAAQAAGGNVEIPPVLLHQDVPRDLR